MTGIRLVCVTDEYSSLNLGVTTVLNGLLREAGRNRIAFSDIKLVSTGSDDYATIPDYVEHIKLHYSKKSVVQNAWRCPPGFSKQFLNILKDSDIVHIHGVWMGPQYHVANLCIKFRKPFIFTPHGMLEPWQWHDKGVHGYLKKRFYWRTIAYPNFKKAFAIHAITPLERENLKILFPENRIEVIPNAVAIHQKSQIDLNYTNNHILEPIILFLGRIHPNKGIELLIRAFALADLPSKWKLVIVGPEEVSDYARTLKGLIVANDLSKKVDIIGPLYGKEKLELYNRAWVVAVPSYSEVVGMVNIEAATCYTPTITTYETGLSDWEEGGGILIHPNVEDLTIALKNASNWEVVERLNRGLASWKLVQRKYSWDVVGRQWIDLYSDIVTGD
jgi:glycosyltransferase involved in cell wall biosynthesis